MELRHLVEEIETSDKFGELVKETLIAFPPGDPADKEPTYRAGEIGNFFRRSRCYILIYSGQRIDLRATLEALTNHFGNKQIQIRYLVPLRFLGIYGYDFIDFSRFQIRKFSEEELDEILQTEVNKTFYQSNFIDVKQIRDYWFIDLERPKSPSCDDFSGFRLGDHRIPLNFLSPSVEEHAKYLSARWLGLDDYIEFNPTVQREFSAFPEMVEKALEPLVLFDWDSLYGWKPLIGPNSLDIPFIIEINDDFLHAPPSAPQIPPFVPAEKLRDTDEDGREIEEVVYLLVIDASQADLIAKRLSFVLGKTKNERKEIKESFRKIYNLRSRLVHGNEELLDQKRTVKHLCEARSLTRRTIVWFMNYLDHVLDQTSINERNNVGLPTREDLLKVLDLSESRKKIGHLLSILPEDFPQSSSWFDSIKETENYFGEELESS